MLDSCTISNYELRRLDDPQNEVLLAVKEEKMCT